MLCSDGRQRFPRLKEFEVQRFPRLMDEQGNLLRYDAKGKPYVVDHEKDKQYHARPGEGKRVREMRAKLAAGKIPQGWDRLTKDQKKLAKRVASGMSVRDACKLSNVKHENSFYLWRELHPLFKPYYYKQALRYAADVDERLTSKIPRAIRVVEESMDNGDPYFRHDAAVQLLKGRGVYRNSSNVQGEVKQVFSGTVDVKHNHKLDREIALLFVDAMKGKAQGSDLDLKSVRPKVIDVEIIKELPPASGPDASPVLAEVEREREEAKVQKKAS